MRINKKYTVVTYQNHLLPKNKVRRCQFSFSHHYALVLCYRAFYQIVVAANCANI